MPNIPATPYRATTPARVDGLLLKLARGGSRERCLQRLQKAVAATLKGRWKIASISHRDRLFELTRQKPASQPLTRQAFDMARALQAHVDIAWAEAGVIVPGADPELRQVYPAKQAALIAKGGGKGKHKDCSLYEEWALANAKVHAAWALPVPDGGKPQGEGIVIAHPDTGYTKHPEFFASDRVDVSRGYDFEDRKKNPADPLKGQAPGHGTATGSVIMGTVGDQSPGLPGFVTGVAPRADIIPIRVSSGVVHLSFGRVVKSIYHAIEQRAHVISLSLGGPFYSRALQEAVEAAINRGIIVIAAAGNVWPCVVYPAKLESVIAVAASNCVNRPWSKSAAGREVDVAAPGESVWRANAKKSAAKPFSNARSSGTSYATAMTAGACALWLAFHGRNTLIQKYGKENLALAFRTVLRRTARPEPGWKKSKYGAGIIDVQALLAARLPAKKTVLTATPKAKSASAIAAVTEMLPELSKANARVVLAKTWKCSPRQLPTELAPWADEFRYLLATNPELRTAIIGNARAKSLRGLSARTLSRPEMIGKRASSGLRKKLRL